MSVTQHSPATEKIALFRALFRGRAEVYPRRFVSVKTGRGNAAQTALESGHDQAVLFAHYRELVRPKEADRFWCIRPEAGTGKVVAFKPSAA